MVRSLLFSLALVLGLSCSTTPSGPPQETRALLYGSLKVPNGIQSLRLQRALTPWAESNYHLDEAGNFVFRDLQPGTYVVVGFYQNGRLHSFHSLLSAKDHQRLVFEVRPGEVKYAASWAVTGFQPGALGGPGTFSMEDREEPTPKEILRAVLPAFEGSAWEEKLRGALNEDASTRASAP